MYPALCVSKTRNSEHDFSTSSKTYISSISNNSSEQTKEMKNKIKEIIMNWITAKGRGNFPTLSFSLKQCFLHGRF